MGPSTTLRLTKATLVLIVRYMNFAPGAEPGVIVRHRGQDVGLTLNNIRKDTKGGHEIDVEDRLYTTSELKELTIPRSTIAQMEADLKVVFFPNWGRTSPLRAG